MSTRENIRLIARTPFRPYIRLYTSPNKIFEYRYHHIIGYVPLHYNHTGGHTIPQVHYDKR